MKKIREVYNFDARARAFYAIFKNASHLADQDFLNYLFRDDSFFIDCKFNRMDRLRPDEKDAFGSIWYSCCEEKWWSYYTKPGVDELYWHYLAQTAYCENETDVVTSVLKGISTSKTMHLHSSGCLKKYRAKIGHAFTKGHLLRIPAIFSSYAKSFMHRKELFPDESGHAS